MSRVVALLGAMALTGCASVIGEKMQPLALQTVLDGKEIAGLGCTLSNDAGSWTLISPASVMVHKSTGDLAVDCKKDSYAGSATVVSKSNKAVWGNLLLGGGIGYIVDRNTGAGFDYPPNITVTLRQVDMAGIPSTAALAPVEVPLKPMSPSQAAARVY
jgi:hypothetical protein